MIKHKNTILIIVILLSFTTVKAQYFPKNLPQYDHKKWIFGFTLGTNTMNFNLHTVDYSHCDSTILIIQPTLSQGFNVGIAANRNLFEYLDLRFVPTLSFGQRSLNYVLRDTLGHNIQLTKTVESTFLDFPLTLKYKSKRFDGKLNNMRAYVLGGARYSLDLSSQKKKKDNGDIVILKLNPNDFMLTAGVGFEFYLNYFKLGVEFQMAYGLMNVLNKDNTIFTTNVDKLTSKMSWITLTFE